MPPSVTWIHAGGAHHTGYSYAVTTEHMTGTDYPSTLNDLNLEEEDGATLITLLIEYPDIQTRDIVLATGMTDGMEASYARLEGVLASV